MKAIRFHSVGEPDVLVFEDVPEPVPGEGQVRVRVRAIGVNFADTRFRRGEYFVRPKFPQIPGMEAAGEIEEVGSGVTGFAVGDRVMVMAMNAYAEHLVARPDALYPMPAGLSFEDAAALPVQGITAHHCLSLCGHLKAGERVLVHAAAGGVGTLAVQLAKRMGAAQVIATASTEDKRALARELGADAAIDYTKPEWVQEVKDATAGKGVDVILEMLGTTEVLKRNLACLAPFGRMIVLGAASGDTRGTLEPVALMAKNQTVTGYYLTPVREDRGKTAPVLADVAEHVAAGRIRVVIGAKFPLSEAAEAHRRMEGRGTVGKVVLLP